MTSWLTLQDYSIKKGVSVSTLRRKIKNSELEYRLENGRYLIKADLETSNKESYLNPKNSISKELKNLRTDKEDLLSLVHFLEEEQRELKEQFITLRNHHKDLQGLVSFLEQEKNELLNHLEQNPTHIST